MPTLIASTFAIRTIQRTVQKLQKNLLLTDPKESLKLIAPTLKK